MNLVQNTPRTYSQQNSESQRGADVSTRIQPRLVSPEWSCRKEPSQTGSVGAKRGLFGSLLPLPSPSSAPGATDPAEISLILSVGELSQATEEPNESKVRLRGQELGEEALLPAAASPNYTTQLHFYLVLGKKKI